MPKRDLPAQIQQQPMANNVHVPQMFQQQQQPTVDPNFYAQQQLQQQQQQHQLALYQVNIMFFVSSLGINFRRD